MGAGCCCVQEPVAGGSPGRHGSTGGQTGATARIGGVGVPLLPREDCGRQSAWSSGSLEIVSRIKLLASRLTSRVELGCEMENERAGRRTSSKLIRGLDMVECELKSERSKG